MALIPPGFLDTVVAIGVGDSEKDRRWVGTGFLYGNLVATTATPPESSYNVWLVTNKHVLAGLNHIYLKFNSAVGSDSKDYMVPLIARNGRMNWVGHPDESRDVAAIAVPVKYLRDDKRHFAYFCSDRHVAGVRRLKGDGATEGDRVFVLGFPMGLVDVSRQYVICRGGVVARIRDLLDGRARDFLVDATVFPGNSGGPVVRCPAALAIEGTQAVSTADLIGMVKSYVPYRDTAVSAQTRVARIVFEENSGLAIVETADAIIETVRRAERRLKTRIATRKHRAIKREEGIRRATVVSGAQRPTPSVRTRRR